MIMEDTHDFRVLGMLLSNKCKPSVRPFVSEILFKRYAFKGEGQGRIQNPDSRPNLSSFTDSLKIFLSILEPWKGKDIVKI